MHATRPPSHSEGQAKLLEAALRAILVAATTEGIQHKHFSTAAVIAQLNVTPGYIWHTEKKGTQYRRVKRALTKLWMAGILEPQSGLGMSRFHVVDSEAYRQWQGGAGPTHALKLLMRSACDTFRCLTANLRRPRLCCREELPRGCGTP